MAFVCLGGVRERVRVDGSNLGTDHWPSAKRGGGKGTLAEERHDEDTRRTDHSVYFCQMTTKLSSRLHDYPWQGFAILQKGVRAGSYQCGQSVLKSTYSSHGSYCSWYPHQYTI